MRAYSEIEKRTIQLLVQQCSVPVYHAINAYNDLFHDKKVEFCSEPAPRLVFYFGNENEIDEYSMLNTKNEIIEISLLLKLLEQENYISFVSAPENARLSSIKGFESEGLIKVTNELDKETCDILLKCMNDSAIVHEQLKELARQINLGIFLPIRKENENIRFFKQVKQDSRSDLKTSVIRPQIFPSFVLCHNFDWDDSNYHNWYCLHYYDKNGKWHVIGEFRLMHSEGESWDKISDEFTSLPKEFCSLGNTVRYYENMYQVLGSTVSEDVLFALQDSAVNTKVYDSYKNTDPYKYSLCRDSFEAEKCQRLARFIIKGKDIKHAFSFEYIYHPPYNRVAETDWKVVLSPESAPFERCIGIIGENGVGKTQLLRLFIQELISKNKTNFKSDLPIFSSIIAICSTPFDAFMRIEGGDFDMSYEKCCLEQNLAETEKSIMNSLNVIETRGQVNGVSLLSKLIEQLKQELPTEKLDNVFIYRDSGIGILRHYEINFEELHNLIYRLSSGQLHILVLLTRVFEHVRYDTLFVIDEPEVHLHPTAIINFIFLLNRLLEMFKSYAIVTTHSPIVVREMVRKNVFTLRRIDGDSVYISHVGHETFGEDVSVLYRDIFNYDETNSCFRKYVLKALEGNLDYESVVRKIGVDNLSLNSKFYIHNLVQEIRLKKLNN